MGAPLLYVYSKTRADAFRTMLMEQVEGIHFLQSTIITSDRRFRRLRNIHGKETVVFEKQLEPA